MTGTKMTATDVKRALVGRWPDDRYCHVYEAPLDSSRMGTKIDVLVPGLWWSLGHGVDAVEVKVSYSDWRKEIARTDWTVPGIPGRVFSTKWQAERAREHNACGYTPMRDRIHGCFGLPERQVITNVSKSEPWRAHADRFWIACPAELAVKIEPELPERWGLIAVDGGGTRVVVPALTSTRIPFTWQATLGIIRAAADSGRQALWRAENRGYQLGVNAERERVARLEVSA